MFLAKRHAGPAASMRSLISGFPTRRGGLRSRRERGAVCSLHCRPRRSFSKVRRMSGDVYVSFGADTGELEAAFALAKAKSNALSREMAALAPSP